MSRPLFVLATSQSPDLSETLATAYNPGMCLLALPVIHYLGLPHKAVFLFGGTT